MTMGQSVNDPRAAFRVFAAALSFAIAATVQYVSPGFPETLMVAWMAVFMGAVGFGEVLFDNRAGTSPKAPLAVEVMTPDPTDSEAKPLPVEISALAPEEEPVRRSATAAAPPPEEG